MRGEPPITFRQEALLITLSSNDPIAHGGRRCSSSVSVTLARDVRWVGCHALTALLITASFVATATAVSSLIFDLRRLVMKHGDLRANEIGKVLVPELDRTDIGPGFKHDGLVFRQELIHIHFHPVEIPAQTWAHS